LYGADDKNDPKDLEAAGRVLNHGLAPDHKDRYLTTRLPRVFSSEETSAGRGFWNSDLLPRLYAGLGEFCG
jgi:hypothetical protein